MGKIFAFPFACMFCYVLLFFNFWYNTLTLRSLFSLSLNLADTQPSVQLLAVSETSLKFTWNEYKHCNNDSIFVEYEYKLYQDYATLIYAGKETHTFISFNNLESDTGYSFQLAVHVTVLSTGSIDVLERWGWVYERTASTGMLHACELLFGCKYSNIPHIPQ